MSWVEGLVVDIDGVLTVSWRPLAGAPEALRSLRDLDVPLTFATNTTSRTRDDIASLLRSAGFEVGADEILTAPRVTAEHLRQRYGAARVLLVNEGDISADLEGFEVVHEPPADVVVVGGAGPAFSYEVLNSAFAALIDGAPLVAMHRNLTWRTDEGLQLDSGGFVGALEEAAGVKATVVGKPSHPFFQASVAALGLPSDRVAMVGDDVHNDVLAAQACGLRGVLVRTGKFRADDLEGLATKPDTVVDSFADVPDLLGPST
jgi:HAD superfamily hydrolase (TIGR01458 family)